MSKNGIITIFRFLAILIMVGAAWMSYTAFEHSSSSGYLFILIALLAVLSFSWNGYMLKKTAKK